MLWLGLMRILPGSGHFAGSPTAYSGDLKVSYDARLVFAGRRTLGVQRGCFAARTTICSARSYYVDPGD